jgi:hypothetical protein
MSSSPLVDAIDATDAVDAAMRLQTVASTTDKPNKRLIQLRCLLLRMPLLLLPQLAQSSDGGCFLPLNQAMYPCLLLRESFRFPTILALRLEHC